jgi:hypothetical protein
MKSILIVKAGRACPDMASWFGDFEDWFAARLDRSATAIDTVSPFSETHCRMRPRWAASSSPDPTSRVTMGTGCWAGSGKRRTSEALLRRFQSLCARLVRRRLPGRQSGLYFVRNLL